MMVCSYCGARAQHTTLAWDGCRRPATVFAQPLTPCLDANSCYLVMDWDEFLLPMVDKNLKQTWTSFLYHWRVLLGAGSFIWLGKKSWDRTDGNSEYHLAQPPKNVQILSVVTRPWVLGDKVLGSLSLLYCGFDIISEKTQSVEDKLNIEDGVMLGVL